MTPAPDLRTLGQWYNMAYQRFGPKAGLVGLEQACYQSIRAKVCIRCLASEGLVRQTSRALIKASDYNLCAECIADLPQDGAE